MEKFIETYEDNNAVNSYLLLKDLQKPEEKIIQKYYDKINNSVLLDVGIGTGRTTFHLYPITSKYVGVDVSKNMIEGAKKNFVNNNIDFKVCDARDMSVFEDNTFDVVFFSFNGIDYVNFDERILFFNEVKRISKKNALLVFSTHNINFCPTLFKFPFSWNPLEFYGRLLRYFKIKSLNDTTVDIKKLKHVKINDGAHNYGLETTFVNPKFQKELLIQYGFKDVFCFGSQTGEEINDSELEEIKDPWIYFTCFVNQ
jgi:ubiquinone/menaquinone biosynthesis C-methylase UbiE